MHRINLIARIHHVIRADLMPLRCMIPLYCQQRYVNDRGAPLRCNGARPGQACLLAGGHCGRLSPGAWRTRAAAPFPGWIRACGWIECTMVHKSHPEAPIHPDPIAVTNHTALPGITDRRYNTRKRRGVSGCRDGAAGAAATRGAAASSGRRSGAAGGVLEQPAAFWSSRRRSGAAGGVLEQRRRSAVSMPSGRQNLVRDADAQAAEALALALDLDDLIRPAWRVDATWVPAAPWAGWLLGGYGEQAAQVIGPGRVAGYPDRVVSGPAPQPAQ